MMSIHYIFIGHEVQQNASKVGSNIVYKYEWRDGERGRSGEGKGGREMAKRKGKGRGKDSFVRPVLCMLLH